MIVHPETDFNKKTALQLGKAVFHSLFPGGALFSRTFRAAESASCRPAEQSYSSASPGFSICTIASFLMGILQLRLLPNSTMTVSSWISITTP